MTQDPTPTVPPASTIEPIKEWRNLVGNAAKANDDNGHSIPSSNTAGRWECDELIIKEQCVRNRRYWVTVYWNREAGLYRIGLIDHQPTIPYDPDGRIARSLYTFKRSRMIAKANTIRLIDDPLGYCAGLIEAWNCEDTSGPISLDSTLMNRVALVPNQPPLETVR